MRFTNEIGLFQVLQYSSQRLARILTVPVTNAYRGLRRVLNPNGFTTRVMADVRRKGKELITGKPKSLKDYFSVGDYYIAKKLVFFVAVLLLILPVVYLKFVHPVVKSNLLTVPVVVNSTEMTGYTGKVELYGSKGGTVLYRGPLKEGRITGNGRLYDYDGNLVYQGDFLMEQYEGSGETFWPSGRTQYTGGFAANLYEGRGKLYREDGSLLYDGEFSAGKYNGTGSLYNPDGSLLYEGGFAAGAYEGTGTLYQQNGKVLYTGGFVAGAYEGDGLLYEENGDLLYQGGFKAGEYEGEGRLYENGSILYQGGFKSGLMEGEGTLYSGETVIYQGGFVAGQFSGAGKEYDPIEGRLLYDGGFVAGRYEGEGRKFDPDTGELVYQGSFYQGEYDGDGILYNPSTQLPLYEGGFRAGRSDGEGVQYDEVLGVPVYEGGFRMGVYHGTGTLYDPVTGFVTQQGEFRNGQVVLPGMEGEVTAPDPGTGGTEGSGGGGSGSGGGQTGGGSDQTGGGSGETSGGGSTAGQNYYTGPTTQSGGVDYSALAGMTPSAIQQQFQSSPSSWQVSGEEVLVYSDKTDGIGVAIRTDGSGHTISVDVWNDAPVAGAKVGMTRSETDSALGTPSSVAQQTMGEGRMISVSQSNRYFGRLTNLSPESQVTVCTYETASGTVQAIFASSTGQCLLLEVLP